VENAKNPAEWITSRSGLSSSFVNNPVTPGLGPSSLRVYKMLIVPRILPTTRLSCAGARSGGGAGRRSGWGHAAACWAGACRFSIKDAALPSSLKQRVNILGKHRGPIERPLSPELPAWLNRRPDKGFSQTNFLADGSST
jgi:hypothetical protein